MNILFLSLSLVNRSVLWLGTNVNFHYHYQDYSFKLWVRDWRRKVLNTNSKDNTVNKRSGSRAFFQCVSPRFLDWVMLTPKICLHLSSNLNLVVKTLLIFLFHKNRGTAPMIATAKRAPPSSIYAFWKPCELIQCKKLLLHIAVRKVVIPKQE